MKRFSAGLFAILSFALVLGACSKSKQLEDKVADLMSSQLQAKNVKVDCPGGVKAEKGEQLDCTVTGDFSAQGTDTTSVRVHVDFAEDNSFSIDAITPLNGSAASTASDESATDTSSVNPSSDTSSDTLPGGDEN